eukprot:7385730-Prymnesium_polylepis.2
MSHAVNFCRISSPTVLLPPSIVCDDGSQRCFVFSSHTAPPQAAYAVRACTESEIGSACTCVTASTADHTRMSSISS